MRIRKSLAPMTREASTYSNPLICRMEALMSLAYFGKDATPSAMTALLIPGPIAVASAIASRTLGIDGYMSRKRIM
jgi:hypothetical protein